ncbi:hypothetical protein TNCV_1594561 [Trichonephila clavipes]|nr:hypothetical protein TNCV_1594561 [Trichonephila clavipes]
MFPLPFWSINCGGSPTKDFGFSGRLDSNRVGTELPVFGVTATILFLESEVIKPPFPRIMFMEKKISSDKLVISASS